MTRFAALIYAAGALIALASVGADAYAAHGLAFSTATPDPEQAIKWFGIAANFQMNHALALILVTIVAERVEAPRAKTVLRTSAVFLAIGAVLFPAALYSLSFAGPSFFAPYGGIAAMIGWVLFILGVVLTLKRS